jgi:hypothetical protein
MDQGQFDRIARLLGGAVTRRAGLGAAFAALTGSRIAADGEAKGSGRSKPGIEGPCGNGSRKRNICTKNSDCCTGLCNTKAGKKNKDGKGRCRCIQKGKACKADKNCCNTLKCNDGVCGSGGAGVPTGDACTSSDICADTKASCTTYQAGTPTGTFCLLADLAACDATKQSQCASNWCSRGVCEPRVTCLVCATGCEYTTVQAALTALTATADAVISIGEGTYDEDLTLATGDDFQLRNCNGETVVLRNKTAATRTISASDRLAVSPKLTITDLTVTSSSGIGNPGGGIEGTMRLVLDGTASVTGNHNSGFGGGMNLFGKFNGTPGACSLTMNNQASITKNYASGTGGGGGGIAYAVVTMNDDSSISENDADTYGGALNIYEATVVMNDNATMSNNTSVTCGGAMYLYGDGNQSPILVMHDNSSLDGNKGRMAGGPYSNKQFGGGAIRVATDNIITMDGASRISGNQTAANGGGIVTRASVALSGKASISGNSTMVSGGGGGVFLYVSLNVTVPPVLTLNDQGSVTGNTPDQCTGYNFNTSSVVTCP